MLKNRTFLLYKPYCTCFWPARYFERCTIHHLVSWIMLLLHMLAHKIKLKHVKPFPNIYIPGTSKRQTGILANIPFATVGFIQNCTYSALKHSRHSTHFASKTSIPFLVLHVGLSVSHEAFFFAPAFCLLRPRNKFRRRNSLNRA